MIYLWKASFVQQTQQVGVVMIYFSCKYNENNKFGPKVLIKKPYENNICIQYLKKTPVSYNWFRMAIVKLDKNSNTGIRNYSDCHNIYQRKGFYSAHRV